MRRPWNRLAARMLAVQFSLLVLSPIGLVPALPAVAHETPDYATPEFVDAQRELHEALSRINAVFGEHDGYVWPEIEDTLSMKLQLVWHNPTDASVRRVRELAGNTVSLFFYEYPMTKARITSTAEYVMEQSSPLLAGEGLKIESVAANPKEEPGITVTVSELASATRTGGSTEDRAAAAGRQLADAHSNLGVPIRVVLGEPVVPTSRTNSTGGMPAGTFLKSGWLPMPPVCSVGFGYVYQGVQRAMTARHCDRNDYRMWDAGVSGPNRITQSIFVDNTTATRLTDGRGSAYAYLGGISSSTYRPIASTVNLAVNSYVCTSGGNSGEHCNIKVLTLMYLANDAYGQFWSIQAGQMTSGGVAVCEGDSGGPVITYWLGSHLGAAGILQAGSHAVNKPALNASWKLCYHNVYFTSVAAFHATAGGQLMTA